MLAFFALREGTGDSWGGRRHHEESEPSLVGHWAARLHLDPTHEPRASMEPTVPCACSPHTLQLRDHLVHVHILGCILCTLDCRVSHHPSQPHKLKVHSGLLAGPSPCFSSPELPEPVRPSPDKGLSPRLWTPVSFVLTLPPQAWHPGRWMGPPGTLTSSPLLFLPDHPHDWPSLPLPRHV